MSTTTGVIEVTCISCGSKHIIIVPTEGYKLWRSGQMHIQDALPGLSADEREMLLSGICPTCWDKLFGGE